MFKAAISVVPFFCWVDLLYNPLALLLSLSLTCLSFVLCSAMGKVTLLSGQPKEDVLIEARSESEGFYEEATTDKIGNFRLRGLIPDTTYLVRVVSKETPGVVPIERSSPEYISIDVCKIVNYHALHTFLD